MMGSPHPFITELLQDIDSGKIQPLTTVKNIEGILAEFVSEYTDYDVMLSDLEEWGYIQL